MSFRLFSGKIGRNEKIGLFAGEGALPVIFAQKAKVKMRGVIAFAITGLAAPQLERYVEKMHWFNWQDLKKVPHTLKEEHIRQIILLGKMKKAHIFKNNDIIDGGVKTVLDDLKDKRDYALLQGIARILRMMGFGILSATTFLEEFVPEQGVLTGQKPTEDELRDVKIGRSVARKLAHFDIGQTVCVKNKVVLALEGPEGTDEAIARAGRLGNKGMAVVKMARPRQDMRLDIPLVGTGTIEAMAKTGARLLAVEKKKTLILEKDSVIRRADQLGIAIIAI